MSDRVYVITAECGEYVEDAYNNEIHLADGSILPYDSNVTLETYKVLPTPDTLGELLDLMESFDLYFLEGEVFAANCGIESFDPNSFNLFREDRECHFFYLDKTEHNVTLDLALVEEIFA